jgi:hypothetical protein
MNKDEALKTKFVGLSKRFELVDSLNDRDVLDRTKKYIKSVAFSDLYLAKLKNELGFSDYFSEDDSKVWGYEQCPLFITCNLLSLYIDYRVIDSYTLDNKKSYTKKTWVESTLDEQTKEYKGDALLKIEKEIKEINKNKFKNTDYRDNTSEGYQIGFNSRAERKRTIKEFEEGSVGPNPHYTKSIVDGNDVYTGVYNKKTTMYHRVYVLQYKNVWCKISEDEKNELLESIYNIRDQETLSELMNLDVSSIKDNQRF